MSKTELQEQDEDRDARYKPLLDVAGAAADMQREIASLRRTRDTLIRLACKLLTHTAPGVSVDNPNETRACLTHINWHIDGALRVRHGGSLLDADVVREIVRIMRLGG